MEEENTITIAGRTFKVEAPTLKQLQQLKDVLGFDIVNGLTGEQSKSIFNDLKKVAEVITIIVTEIPTPGNEGDMPVYKDDDELTEFFFDKAKITDFKRVFNFFSESLK